MHRTQEFRAKLPEIRRILMERWDPIGVREETMAADEYDEYATQIFGLLARGASDDQVVGYLGQAEDQIGLGRSPRKFLTPIVASLRGLGIKVAASEADV